MYQSWGKRFQSSRHGFHVWEIPTLCLVLLGSSGCSTPGTSPPSSSNTLPADLVAQSEEVARQVIKVTDGVYVAIGFGIANSILIEAPEGRIIVDTQETVGQGREVKAEFDKLSTKPVAAIIYTHNHPDHVYGAAAFDETGDLPIYAHNSTAHLMDELISVIRPAMNRRAAHMYGTLLKGDAFVNVGIGPFVGMFDPKAQIELRRPNRTFEDKLEVTIAGERVVLLHAPGETQDQIYVWLPDRKTLLCGDNYYRAFPNIYTLRGTSFRDPVQWYRSLDLILNLHPKYLVPSHTRPLSGSATIHDVITTYRDAIQYLHDQTIRGINAGKSPDELAATIQLPPHLAQSPYLKELYGSVPWCVRAIYSGYLGWFDGNPTHLRPLPPAEHARRMITLAGGQERMLSQVQEAARGKDWQWVLELTDVLLQVEPDLQEVKDLRIAALKTLGAVEANPNSRHWYYTAALELEQNTIATIPNNPTPEFLHAIPLSTYFGGLVTHLRAEDTLDLERSANFVFSDSGEEYHLVIRRGVAEAGPGLLPTSDLTVTVKVTVFKEMLAGLRSGVDVLASGEVQAEPGLLQYADFMRHFLAE